LVEEKDLIIPNMRGIMSARTKPLQVVEPTSSEVKVEAVLFDSVPPRAAVKLVSPDNLDELVRLLHEEAKLSKSFNFLIFKSKKNGNIRICRKYKRRLQESSFRSGFLR
jgi:hypothetical protein